MSQTMASQSTTVGGGADRRAVLWDMDGTLLDSAEFHWLIRNPGEVSCLPKGALAPGPSPADGRGEMVRDPYPDGSPGFRMSWQEALREEGVDITRDRFLSTFGRRNDAVLRDLLGDDLVDAEIVRIAAAKEHRYRELVRTGEIVPLPGVRHWLARLSAAGWRHAVASSAPRLNIATILEALELVDAFDAVTGEEDVDRGKPDPQIFLVAAERLGVPPARCVVVEDARAGIDGARRAGMRSIGVGTGHGGRLEADIVVPSLEVLPHDAFDQLVADTTAQ